MHGIVILVPRRRDYGHRDRLWDFVKRCWVEHFPTYAIHEGFHEEDEPFNRSKALNRAAAEAGDWEIAIVIDSDVVIDNVNLIYEAIRVASRGRLASAFDVRKHLSRDATDAILAGVPFGWELHATLDEENAVSGALVVPRDLWDRAHGFDEKFIGFGYEDLAFVIVCETMSERKIYRASGILWHLWHEKSPEDHEDHPGLIRNKERWMRYAYLQFSPKLLEAFILNEEL